MCGIAEVLHAAGYQVTGSDIQESVRTRFMQSLGMKISFGHRAENLGDAEMVVRSSAVDDSNSEILEAQASGRSVIRRSQCLGILMKSSFVIPLPSRASNNLETFHTSPAPMVRTRSPAPARSAILLAAS